VTAEAPASAAPVPTTRLHATWRTARARIGAAMPDLPTAPVDDPADPATVVGAYALCSAAEVDAAVRAAAANRTEFGLVASVWSDGATTLPLLTRWPHSEETP
jgi:delta 1-pyrroline-5-carboxylate dehydrogenase